MWRTMLMAVELAVLLFVAPPDLSAQPIPSPWLNDFAIQPIANRPPLEVRYTDGTRDAFEISAAGYQLLGELRKPHCLRDAASGEVWLELSVQDTSGTIYSVRHAAAPSRINLYRRGPYYCEVHWLDLSLADEAGNIAPLKGDLALYCYPRQILGSVTWHAISDFEASSVRIEGRTPRDLGAAHIKAKTSQRFSFSIFGVTEPLVETRLETLSGVEPLQYDRVRGCYTVGSENPSGFEGHFYQHPNHYETAQFRVTNDDQPRTIYVCHRTSRGVRGVVEGGVLLDELDHPLPITVQISKNFAGEREERFYNPTDEPFSETWFPLVLAPHEQCTISSLHLYQNWGRHMVKQFSSLGAWMDYFHSSTGVTETTCYVPFKFGGLKGVAVADFRAMSQSSFWGGQPQHDNVAGHSFLSYHDGERWQYLAYRGTTYHSTGPNWMDITLDYLSTDGKVRASVRTFELPQDDELRNFLRVRYEILEPIVVRQAKENFRLLTIASWVQKLRYTHFAAAGIPDRRLAFDADHFDILGQSIPQSNSFLALYGESKGSNAIMLRSWSAPFKPAGSVWCEKNGDTRLLLVPDCDDLVLEPGDAIELDAIFLPYGEIAGAETCRREAIAYGSDAPRVTEVGIGEKLSDFPATIRAIDDRADFVIQGGRNVVPIVVTGLSDYRWPSLYLQSEEGRRYLAQARVGDKDGVQVFCDADGSYAAVFLVASDSSSQALHFETGHPPVATSRIRIDPSTARDAAGDPGVQIQANWMKDPVGLQFPAEASSRGERLWGNQSAQSAPAAADARVTWATSAGGSLWYEVNADGCTLGGRLSPNEDDVDLEYWIRNRQRRELPANILFQPILDATSFADPQRIWILQDQMWRRLTQQSPLSFAAGEIRAVAVTSTDGREILAIAWPRMVVRRESAESFAVQCGPDWPACPPGRRLHVRGKLYLMHGSLEDLRLRVQREIQ